MSSRRRVLTLLVVLGVLGGQACLTGSASDARPIGEVAGIAATAPPATPDPHRFQATAGNPSTSPTPHPSLAAPAAGKPSPPQTNSASKPKAHKDAAGPFAMNLYTRGDFVSQATKDQCVSAAMQIMINVIRDDQDQSSRTQRTLARLANVLSAAPDGGTEPVGWASTLSQLGFGRYKVAVEPSRAAAIRRAVIALRATRRPAGLLVWRGAHSWVLHGFRATADPARTNDFRITGVYLSDPWYPRISSIWGPSRPPNVLVEPGVLREDYLPWRRPTGAYPGWDGNFLVILPVGRGA